MLKNNAQALYLIQTPQRKISLLVVGKTDDAYINTGVDKYVNRLKHYTSFEIQVIPGLKNAKSMSETEIKKKEAEQILKQVEDGDYLVLLDERGKQFSSTEFSKFITTCSIRSVNKIVFVVGGAYGFDEQVYKRTNEQISLSRMTFSHQMVRLFFIEQLYRAFTILKGEPYHHS